MARIEGTQDIPSELLYLYKGALGQALPNDSVRKRIPFSFPLKQDGGYKVTALQKGQRSRWLAVRDKFKSLDAATRSRWYAARPPWNSLLWYYNYFMMSGLMGNAMINDKGAGVIKDINHYTFNLPTGTAPDATITVDACDPAKSVPFFFGAGVLLAEADIPVAVYPYLKNLASTQMIIGASMGLSYPANLSVTLIEYI